MLSMRSGWMALFALCVLTGGTAVAQSPHTHDHSFSGARQWSKVFDDPQRDAWQKPAEVIEALRLARDAVVADVGAGTGYFAVRLAHAAPKGRVYAVDTEPDMVEHLKTRAQHAGLKNLVAILGAPTDPRLPEKADLILLVDVYHHINDRERYFANLLPRLKTGGRVAIIDFRMDSPHGPPRAARVEAERVKAELKRAGYELREEHALLPYQYFLVFAHASR